jgi:hypothetical protein
MNPKETYTRYYVWDNIGTSSLNTALNILGKYSNHKIVLLSECARINRLVPRPKAGYNLIISLRMQHRQHKDLLDQLVCIRVTPVLPSWYEGPEGADDDYERRPNYGTI